MAEDKIYLYNMDNLDKELREFIMFLDVSISKKKHDIH